MGGVDVNGCGLSEVNWVSFGNFGLSGGGVDVILLARIDDVDSSFCLKSFGQSGGA